MNIMLETIKELLGKEDKQEMARIVLESEFNGVQALLTTLDNVKSITYKVEEIDDYLRYKVIYRGEIEESFFIGFNTALEINMAIAIVYNITKGVEEALEQTKAKSTTYIEILNQITNECAEYYNISSACGARTYPAVFVKYILENL